ncbi:hypothetical protein DPMN_180866 [Dreissena polymorpha]|uniref:Uncharacterized protein n=1 Tax=Dreissena polymorpha TaxID=45954 RepID=A0A9D4DD56_DREPO|nr:hypothetical protein DPMN_180866 [Dreissena polymorpha]
MLMKTKESPHVIEAYDETIPKLPMVSRDLQQNGRELSISNRDLARNDRKLQTNIKRVAKRAATGEIPFSTAAKQRDRTNPYAFRTSSENTKLSQR